MSDSESEAPAGAAAAASKPGIPLSFSRKCLFQPSAVEAAREAAAAAAAANGEEGSDSAVDDSEDLPDDDVDEAKETSSYGARRGSGGADGKFGRLREVLPFAFHPNVRPLSINDLESCVALENAAFENPGHRCTREKFEYRLSTCPELSMGLFCTIVPDKAQGFEIDTFATAQPAETGRNDGSRSVLIAHIVATKSHKKLVTDEAMDYPRDFRTNKHKHSSLGHQEGGQTICIHSLAVHPKLHGCHLGKLIMKAYLQQLKNADIAEYCSLICQDYLVSFYERFGFVCQGPSKATLGGGGWFDMTLRIEDLPPYHARVAGGVRRV
ncbi:acyl-CoA N-acyltransferase [Hypoxylon sp. FL1857]|nr:acyl-CoA N-acyltransferase [Hypoxylon sp. FL1857]